MRDRQQILDDYTRVSKNTEMRVQKGYERVYEYANIDERRALREEYVRTLDEDKQLAIKLIVKFEKNLAEYSYEITGIEDDWEQYVHKKYLTIARKMIEAFKNNGGLPDSAFSAITAIIDCL